jgi:hypothetical protein
MECIFGHLVRSNTAVVLTSLQIGNLTIACNRAYYYENIVGGTVAKVDFGTKINTLLVTIDYNDCQATLRVQNLLSERESLRLLCASG